MPALPIGARLVVDPWDGRLELLRSAAALPGSLREKTPLGITPLTPHLRYPGSPAPPLQTRELPRAAAPAPPVASVEVAPPRVPSLRDVELSLPEPGGSAGASPRSGAGSGAAVGTRRCAANRAGGPRSRPGRRPMRGRGYGRRLFAVGLGVRNGQRYDDEAGPHGSASSLVTPPALFLTPRCLFHRAPGTGRRARCAGSRPETCTDRRVFRAGVAAFVLLGLTAGCGTSVTQLTGPDQVRCDIGLANTSSSVPAVGAQLSVVVIADRDAHGRVGAMRRGRSCLPRPDKATAPSRLL